MHVKLVHMVAHNCHIKTKCFQQVQITLNKFKTFTAENSNHSQQLQKIYIYIQLSPKGEVNSGGHTDREGDSCFSINQIRWIKKRFFNFFFWNFRETTRHFSLRSQNSEYPRLLNSQPLIMHFAYFDWFTQSWLSAHIPWFDLIW